MMSFHKSVWLLLSALLLGGCAVNPPPFPPQDLGTVDTRLTPQQVNQDSALLDRRVLWGGVIVESRNAADHTELTVLAYPLDTDQEPDTGKDAIGRFLLRKLGYLETLVYAPKREITVVGTIKEIQERTIGDTSYRYPVVEVDRIHLWPLPQPSPPSRVRFGVGVGIIR